MSAVLKRKRKKKKSYDDVIDPIQSEWPRSSSGCTRRFRGDRSRPGDSSAQSSSTEWRLRSSPLPLLRLYGCVWTEVELPGGEWRDTLCVRFFAFFFFLKEKEKKGNPSSVFPIGNEKKARAQNTGSQITREITSAIVIDWERSAFGVALTHDRDHAHAHSDEVFNLCYLYPSFFLHPKRFPFLFCLSPSLVFFLFFYCKPETLQLCSLGKPEKPEACCCSSQSYTPYTPWARGDLVSQGCLFFSQAPAVLCEREREMSLALKPFFNEHSLFMDLHEELGQGCHDPVLFEIIWRCNRILFLTNRFTSWNKWL